MIESSPQQVDRVHLVRSRYELADPRRSSPAIGLDEKLGDGGTDGARLTGTPAHRSFGPMRSTVHAVRRVVGSEHGLFHCTRGIVEPANEPFGSMLRISNPVHRIEGPKVI